MSIFPTPKRVVPCPFSMPIPGAVLLGSAPGGSECCLPFQGLLFVIHCSFPFPGVMPRVVPRGCVPGARPRGDAQRRSRGVPLPVPIPVAGGDGGCRSRGRGQVAAGARRPGRWRGRGRGAGARTG